MKSDLFFSFQVIPYSTPLSVASQHNSLLAAMADSTHGSQNQSAVLPLGRYVHDT